jgi:hypothetical protein
MRKMMILGSIMLGVLMLAPYGFAEEGDKHGKETRMKVSGVVSKVQSSHVTIKTPWGTDDHLIYSRTSEPRSRRRSGNAGE